MDESTTLFLALPSHDSPTCSFWWRSKPSRFCTIWKLFSFEFVIKQRTHVIDSAGARESWSSIVCVCARELLAQLPEFCSCFFLRSLVAVPQEWTPKCLVPLCWAAGFVHNETIFGVDNFLLFSVGAQPFWWCLAVLYACLLASCSSTTLFVVFFRRFFMFSWPSGGAEKKLKLKPRGSCDSFRAFACNL